MFKMKNEMNRLVRENVRNGNGTVGFTNVFEKEELFEKCNLCAVLDFEPGTSIGEHPHNPDAELYYILEGELTVTENGVKKTLKPGDAVFTGGGSVHSVANVSNSVAKMLAIVIR
ncbi:MAG: cupin domain-containing protein [Clostridiales bacterium]|nr:cupin domain-containing protein [Clostridiales bacterium]